MIFEVKPEEEAVLTGDIQSNSVSIDTANIDFIVTLLSTNLYSQPIQSFIRETVSNAWDSHVEAGVDEPVILELGTDTEGEGYCRIQDFGMGLSPERFDSIYRNIGSSTKRADARQIGGFGIGRFSALAYSHAVYITSIFEGKKYLYMMYKDNHSSKIDLLNTTDTTERNGVEVKVPVKSGDKPAFERAIKTQLVYFENLYVVDNDATTEDEKEESIEGLYNNFVIKKFDNFWVNSLDNNSGINLILGKVRYPIRMQSLSGAYSSEVQNYPISLVFEIGDLQITPNREEVMYHEDNIAKIEQKLTLALSELKIMMEEARVEDFSTIKGFLEAKKSTSYLNLYEDEAKGIKIRIKTANQKRHMTFLGSEYDSEVIDAHVTYINHRIDVLSYDYILNGGSISYQSGTFSIDDFKNKYSHSYYCDMSNLKAISKRYIRETFPSYSTSYFIKPVTRAKAKRLIKKELKRFLTQIDQNKRGGMGTYDSLSRDVKTFDKKLIKHILNGVMENFKNLPTFKDSSVPKDWIEDTKAADKAKRDRIKGDGVDWKQNINIFYLREKEYRDGISTTSQGVPLSELGTIHKGLTIFAEKDNEYLRTLFGMLPGTLGVKMVEVAPTRVKILEKVDNFVNINNLLDVKYSLIRNVATVELIKKEIPRLKEMNDLQGLNRISTVMAEKVKFLQEFVSKYEMYDRGYRNLSKENKMKEDIFTLCRDANVFNEIVRAELNLYKDLINKGTYMIPFLRGSSDIDTAQNTLVDIALSRKLFRPNYQAVNQLKEQTIYNIIKKEEDEIN